MSNTLLNYFKKTPAKTPAKGDTAADKSDVKKEIKIEDKENITPKRPKVEKKPINKDDEIEMIIDDDEDVKPPKSQSKSTKKPLQEKDDSPINNVKRKRVLVVSDSDESEKEEDKKSKTKSSKKAKIESESDYEMDDDDEEEEATKPKKTIISKKKLELDSFSSPSASKSKGTSSVTSSPSTAKTNLSSFASNYDPDSGAGEMKFKHLALEWLNDDKIKDINGNLKSDPNYDPRTIYVPPEYKKSLTPALRQWWELKSTNFDVIFFFKVGKFYELYHMDAMIAVKELGLTFMKGDYAHCGFPEIAYSRFADSLVSKGYKVGRVEQTETPDMMTERTKGTKQDKTVRREVCRITTPGTKTFNLLDSDVANAFSQYLFAFIEKINLVQDKKVRTYGVCFVDTTVGKVYIGQFEDDRNCSKFRTTLAHYPPAHILYDRNCISKETKSIIEFQNGIKEALASDKEMYSSGKVLRMLTETDYFKEKSEFAWPETFKVFLSENDSLGLTPKSEYEHALNAFGGILWCLKNCLIDSEILTMKNFELYNPVDNLVTNDIQKAEIKKTFMKQKYMVLDSISLTNLEIFENNFDNTQTGTLFEQIDFCNTHFGKRLLKYWLVNPLCDPDAINDRLDALEDLKTMEDKLSNINEQLKNLPDLERLMSKIHHLGNVKKDHPDSRAIMYENDTYSKKKIEDFINLLNGFSVAAKLLNSLKECCPNLKSNLLRSILTITKEKEKRNTGFPFLDDLLKFFNTSFDAEKAKKEGKIIPSAGVNEEYDTAIDDIKSCEAEFESILKRESKVIGCSLKYFGTNKNRYQLEIPETKCKKLPEDYELTSSKKGFKRYWNADIKETLAKLTEAEDRRDAALRNTIKCLFKNFDKHYDVWNRAVQCLSILDVLISLTSYIRNSEHDMCRPEIVLVNEDNGVKTPFVDIRNGRHPCLTKTFSGDFIPNDIVIGCEDSNNNWQKNPLVLVTGPNMGGKSTLMRQAGLTVILAQMGCYVPAESCRLTPVDRIFTRIGASDKILHGESTFFLELSETASILHHATKHSLVLMDELGRGTATFDGTAIAYSVVKELAQKINCRTLFSTHYHHLVEEFSHDDNVSMGHMQSMVSDDDHSITFLYKFGEGACPKSHGFNAARLADIPDEIIKVGSFKSVEFENFSKKIQFLKKLMIQKNKSDMNDVIKKFKTLSSN